MKTVNTQVEYAGLKLKNPIVIASSGLTDSVHKIEVLENSGAAAVVLKSIYEEQIMMNIRKEAPEEEIDKVNIADIISKFISEDHLDNYTSFIRECKTKISIPVIASIN